MVPTELPALHQEQIPVYSPSAIVNIIQNFFALPQEKKLIILKGVYLQKGTMNYSGYWYDELKDESSDNTIKLLVPDLVRNQLTNNKTIEVICFITKKADKKGNISVMATITDLLNQTQNKYNDEEIKAIEIQQQKSQMGYRDLDSFIKKSIYDNQKLIIKVLYGKNAIVDKDIIHQMSEAVALYDISFIPTTITSVTDIISTLKNYNNDQVDIIAITRGGGDEMQILNKPDLSVYCLTLKPYFVTAVEHKVNNPLLEKIADKHFITPTAFGQYLKEIYNNTVEDFESSKAKLAESVTKQLKANFDKQIENLNQQLKAEKDLKQKTLEDKEKVHISAVDNINKLLVDKEKFFTSNIQSAKQEADKYKKDIDSLRNQLASSHSGKSTAIFVAILIALIIGLIIGIAIKSG
jgi:exodeoxyribonuclease VII large subunit